MLPQHSCFILAAEASGDLHGARLIRHLPHLHFFGVPGPRMRSLGVEELLPQEDFELMGFSSLFLALPRLLRQLRLCTAAILRRQPDLVILIDYGAFNLALAQRLRKKGYRGKIVQYICPKVWAWGKRRIPKIAKAFDLVISFFPFEPPYFAGTGLPVEYVGNPLSEEVPQKALELHHPPRLALFPGSRKGEILLNFPRQLETARALQQEIPNLEVTVSVAHEKLAPLIGHPERIALSSNGYQLMLECDAALATSGTVNLELALRQVPTVVVYRLSLFNAFMAGVILRLKLLHYSLPNIVAGKTVFPELMHTDFTVERAKERLIPFLTDTNARQTCLEECQLIKEKLFSPNPSKLAAEKILALLNVHKNGR
ncbi:MAG: lipid-A-disaccharide synthase [Verrucomicrobia bacterium]|nr:lipid-A-disaccharide synthase [Verrucomicrobiota bacterium]